MKDRNISKFEFLNQLQKEYISAEIRSKVYPRRKDKAFWKRVMEGKRETIEKISKDNHLPNIFNDQSVYQTIKLGVTGLSGMPDFNYRDEEQRRDLEKRDFDNYFQTGKEFGIRKSNSVQIGYLQSINRVNKIAHLEGAYTREKITCSLDHIYRIL